jgi:hypothetical protein
MGRERRGEGGAEDTMPAARSSVFGQGSLCRLRAPMRCGKEAGSAFRHRLLGCPLECVAVWACGTAWQAYLEGLHVSP